MTVGAQNENRRVIVVDDDDGLRNLIVKILSKHQFECRSATTGSEAIALAEADPSAVLLLDQQLPDLNGRDIVTALVGMGINPAFIIMTGQGDERLAVEMMKLGAADYLVKDSNFIELLPGVLDRLFVRVETDLRLKAAEKALRESEEKLSSILNNSDDVIWSASWPDMVSYFVSPSAERVCGYPASLFETDSNLWKEITLPEDMPIAEAAMVTLAAKGRAESETRMKKSDGSIVWLRHNTYLIYDEAGTPVRVDSIVSDITARKTAEIALQQQLVEKEALLKETHHRIKNNITAIAGLLSLQAGSLTNPEATAALQEAIGRVRGMSNLYEKMLMRNEYREVVVGEYLGDLADSVTALFGGGTVIEIRKEFDDFSLEPKILFPLGIIVNELLTNAIKYAFPGKGSGVFLVSARKAGNRVTVRLGDDGCGLPPGFNIDESEGFGLMLVRMFCQQLKGRFTIESVGGTRFTIEFDITPKESSNEKTEGPGRLP